MTFHDFIAEHATRQDAVGLAASAALHAMQDDHQSPLDVEHELQYEACCPATYRGVKELWKLWTKSGHCGIDLLDDAVIQR